MAKSNAVWGIDIGQCALKALRCRAGDEAGTVTADAFDYIEYPKILSQPDADPAELVREALRTVPVAQHRARRQGGDLRFGPERPGAVHQAAAGRIEKDSGHRQVRGPAADSLRAGRRRLGLPADGRRQRGRRLRAGDRSRPVRHEARPGVSRAEAVRRSRHRSRRHPAHAADDLQLHGLRSDAGSAAGRSVRS